MMATRPVRGYVEPASDDPEKFNWHLLDGVVAVALRRFKRHGHTDSKYRLHLKMPHRVSGLHPVIPRGTSLNEVVGALFADVDEASHAFAIGWYVQDFRG